MTISIHVHIRNRPTAVLIVRVFQKGQTMLKQCPSPPGWQWIHFSSALWRERSEDVNLGSRRKVNVYLRSASPFRLPIWLSYIRLLPNPSGGSVDKSEQIRSESIKNTVFWSRVGVREWRGEYILGGEPGGGLGECRGLAAGSAGGEGGLNCEGLNRRNDGQQPVFE